MLRVIHLTLLCLLVSRAGAESWWAFRPLKQGSPPNLPGLKSPVDQFVLSRLRDQGMTFAPKASRETLLRRVFVTLVGMPPTLEEVEDFLGANPEGAWERQIDALLEDPRYGEHWATMWLDLVRYSDSDGWNQDDLALERTGRVAPDLRAERPLDVTFEQSELDGPQSWIMGAWNFK